MAKSYFEELQEQAALAEKSMKERTTAPTLEEGPHQFTIIGGASGEKGGRAWSAIVVRHTNGHEYRIFYNLYWPLKPGEISQSLNVNTFNFICGFDKSFLSTYKEKSFDGYFDALTGRSYTINYHTASSGKVYPDFKTLPVYQDVLEETLEVEEINFDEVE